MNIIYQIHIVHIIPLVLQVHEHDLNENHIYNLFFNRVHVHLINHVHKDHYVHHVHFYQAVHHEYHVHPKLSTRVKNLLEVPTSLLQYY